MSFKKVFNIIGIKELNGPDPIFLPSHLSNGLRFGAC
jgi:hypothetical protein